MSTRATYQIEDMTFYCHHDGYPQYAAVRFARMIAVFNVPTVEDTFREVEDRRGSLMFAFVRGNLDAQPTESHEVHGDTEWRYTIRFCKKQKLWVVTSECRNWWEDDEKAQWHSQQTYPLDQFITIHGNDFKAEPVVQFQMDGGTHIATRPHAAAIGANLQKRAGQFQEGNPNKARYAARAEVWILAAAEGPTA
ncbi:hypothetical protein [Aliiroseovarius lamellibrachiae]|uniref:hypothetical protein n=1 Tax=Aliiroseovarius lamellibrachiae TaxID=1924933 RepID=UPI001BE039C3|nr:hypothetical protein [Aliiroseovarius lamellibrachiae]MBT2132656.1 hypothetical protein [Aliiroseovarius lamellibrachiae]